MRLTVGFLAAAIMMSSAACGPAEPDYEKTADAALSSAALGDVDANYDDDAKTIHLTGTVNTENERQRAADVVQQAIGNGAQVANEVTVASATEEIADDFDDALETRLAELVDNEADLKDDRIGFDAHNGVITITGDVDSAAERDRVGDIARSQPGVRDVVNALEVRPNRS